MNWKSSPPGKADLAINDGSIVPGSNMTGAALKAAIKAHL